MNRTLAVMLIGATALLTACTAESGLAVAQQSAVIQEDDPGWDCKTMGNYICGDPQGTHAEAAWQAWDKGEGWRRLRAASTDTRVEYVGTAVRHPKIDALTEVAIPDKGTVWYVFRAVAGE